MRLCVIYICCRHLSTGLNEAKLNHLCKLRLEETSIKCACVCGVAITKSSKDSSPDKHFIAAEVKWGFTEGITEQSTSTIEFK